MRDENLSTIAISKDTMQVLDKYLKGLDAKMSKKEFIEESVNYFIRHGFNPKDDIAVFTPMQNMIAEMEERQAARDQKIGNILQYIQNLQILQSLPQTMQKALPEIQKGTEEVTKAKITLNGAKNALLKVVNNNKYSVSIGRLKHIIEEYFEVEFEKL